MATAPQTREEEEGFINDLKYHGSAPQTRDAWPVRAGVINVSNQAEDGTCMPHASAAGGSGGGRETPLCHQSSHQWHTGVYYSGS